MQAEAKHPSLRQGLIDLLPRLKRFADVLAGAKVEGRALLRRALTRMLAEQHRGQHADSLESWAFGEIYRLWQGEQQAGGEGSARNRLSQPRFEALFGARDDVDRLTASFIEQLSPQQRSTLLLVYGEGFSYEEAGRVLDASVDTVAARLTMVSASFADRITAASRVAPAPPSQSETYDRA